MSKQFNFKEEVPTFLKTDQEQYPTTDKTDVIKYTFSVSECNDSYYRSLSPEQVSDQALPMLLQGQSLAAALSYTYEDQLEIVKYAFGSGKVAGFPTMTYETSDEIKTQARKFFKELECFLDVKFEETSDDNNDDGYQIAICSNEILSSSLGKVGMTWNIPRDWFQLEPRIVNKAFILFDKQVSSDNPLDPHFENTINHQLLNTLGEAQPKYDSLEQQLQYRSVTEDETPLFHWCMGEHLPFLDVIMNCMEPPANLQPVNVKGLQSIWSESQDDSDYCVALRDEFFTEFANDFAAYSNESISSFSYSMYF